MKISHVEMELPDTFLRIHRSFIVNREKIRSFSREYLVLGEKEPPVSRTYRRQVAEILQTRKNGAPD
jgi:DNA-binding LytR/AlgR family response regulator